MLDIQGSTKEVFLIAYDTFTLKSNTFITHKKEHIIQSHDSDNHTKHAFISLAYPSTHASLNHLRPHMNTHSGNLRRKKHTIINKSGTIHVRQRQVRQKEVVSLCATLVLLVDSCERCMKLR